MTRKPFRMRNRFTVPLLHNSVLMHAPVSHTLYQWRKSSTTLEITAAIKILCFCSDLFMEGQKYTSELLFRASFWNKLSTESVSQVWKMLNWFVQTLHKKSMAFQAFNLFQISNLTPEGHRALVSCLSLCYLVNKMVRLHVHTQKSFQHSWKMVTFS